MFIQKYKSEILHFLQIPLVFCAFIIGSHLLLLAFEGGILLTSFMFSIEYLLYNDWGVWVALLQFLLLASLVREYAVNDSTVQRMATDASLNGVFLKDLKFLLFSFRVWGTVSSFLALSILCPFPILFPKFVIRLKNICLFFLLMFGIIVLVILGYLSALKIWRRQDSKDRFSWRKKKKKNGTTLHLVKKCAYLIAIYCLGGVCAPAAIECVANCYRIFLLFSSKLWIIAAVFLTIKVFLYVAHYVRAVIKRKIFTQKLFSLCDRKKVILGQISSVFPLDNRRKNDADFSIVHCGTRYECKFIYSLRKYDTMVLTNYGEGSIVYDCRLGQIHLFRRMTLFRYGFEGRSSKILIILPTPKKVMHSESGRDLDVGDKVGEYTVYTGTAFLNALERNCLNKQLDTNL